MGTNKLKPHFLMAYILLTSRPVLYILIHLQLNLVVSIQTPIKSGTRPFISGFTGSTMNTRESRYYRPQEMGFPASSFLGVVSQKIMWEGLQQDDGKTSLATWHDCIYHYHHY